MLPIAGVPAVDTVKQVERTADGAVVIATVPRERMVLAQTPQGFRFGPLKKAFDEAMADGSWAPTKLLSSSEPVRKPCTVVMGSSRNLKIARRRSGTGRVLSLAGEPPQNQFGRVISRWHIWTRYARIPDRLLGWIRTNSNSGIR